MKKFIVIVVALMVLLMFLMVNYLLWDKENLLKQSENDRIEQDWLRGQNRTLDSTIAEQERQLAALETEKKALEARIEALTADVKEITDRESDYIKTIELQKRVVDTYKEQMTDGLQRLTKGWFDTLAAGTLTLEPFSVDALIFGRKMDETSFSEWYVRNIASINLSMGADGVTPLLFESAGDTNDDYTVRVRAQVSVLLAEGHEDNVGGLSEGDDVVLLTFRYVSAARGWVISNLVAE